MRIIRDPQIISGFIFEEPVDEIPALTHFGEALCCRGHSRPMHTHTGYEFLYLVRGTCHWQTAGTSFRQQMGDLLIVHPQEPHQTGPKPNPENRHLWLGLQLNRLSGDGKRLARALAQSKVRLLEGFHEAEPLLDALLNQIMTLRPDRSQVVDSMLQTFIALVAQRLKISRRRRAASFPAIRPYSFAVQKVLAYMEKNLDRRIPLRELAAVATIRNVSHLCVSFRREVGTTPGFHHVQLRLKAAREALRQPSATIVQVALRFGFCSSQHFSSLFRRAFGVTPRACQTERRMKALPAGKRPQTRAGGIGGAGFPSSCGSSQSRPSKFSSRRASESSGV